jgi:hypothetical protein
MSGLGQLLVTLTRVIAHGQGDEAFVQYSNKLLPNNPNFTIGSFLCLFRRLEKKSRVLVEFEPQNILEGSSCCLNALRHTNKIVGVKPLLRKLLLQMDNCVKDNKNRHLNMLFLSLLIAQKVFEEVQLGFLVVGHTHEDIDNSFGYLSKKKY